MRFPLVTASYKLRKSLDTGFRRYDGLKDDGLLRKVEKTSTEAWKQLRGFARNLSQYPATRLRKKSEYAHWSRNLRRAQPRPSLLQVDNPRRRRGSRAFSRLPFFRSAQRH